MCLALKGKGVKVGQSDTLFRLIALLQAIPRSPFFKSTTTLMMLMEEQGFKVSARMLQRDLEKLSCHFPILCDTSEKPYRWHFIEGYKSNLPALDAVTALSWVLAKEHLKPLLPGIAYDKLKPQFEMAQSFLEAQTNNQLNHWQHLVKAVPNGKALIPARIKDDIWYGVTEGLLTEKIIEVEYLSRKKEAMMRRKLHPMGLVVRYSSTFLLAMIDHYNDVRQLALHRMHSIKVLETNARKYKQFNLEDYIQSGAFGYPISHKNVTLKMLIEPKIAWHLTETPVSHNQTLEKVDDSERLLLTAQVPNDQQTQWWIMGFGSKVEVIQPVEWREAIFKHAIEIINRSEPS